MELGIQNYPAHIAIIPDGCRRWAKANKAGLLGGHTKGIDVLIDVGLWSLGNTPIKYYTAYGLSMENLTGRSKLFLEPLLKLYSEYFIRLSKHEGIHENEVNVGATGRIDLLPKHLQDAIKVAETATSKYTKKYLRIAVAYSGKQEVVDAVSKIQKEGKEVTQESISSHLYNDFPEVDMVFRTSENRVSNFMLWSGSYAEFISVPKLWPDLTKEDYIAALKEYDSRKRRYGK